MQSVKSILLRIAALAPCAGLALVVSACDGDKGYSLPTAPPRPTAPPPSTTLPTSEEATPGTYRRVTQQSGFLEERYLLEPNGTFRLQYESSLHGFFEYLGAYSRQGNWYVFDFEADWRWQAVTSFRGNCVVVEYNGTMVLSDFESGEYCR